MVISNDTGPYHLAKSIGAWTIGIYWCGNMINSGPITQLRNKNLISWMIRCPLCGQDCATQFPFQPFKDGCEHETSFVDRVTVKQAINAIDNLLDTKASYIKRK
jgi:ADP-heptose:LPS heptosyltransferase